jgi:hypothetical protein
MRFNPGNTNSAIQVVSIRHEIDGAHSAMPAKPFDNCRITHIHEARVGATAPTSTDGTHVDERGQLRRTSSKREASMTRDARGAPREAASLACNRRGTPAKSAATTGRDRILPRARARAAPQLLSLRSVRLRVDCIERGQVREWQWTLCPCGWSRSRPCEICSSS